MSITVAGHEFTRLPPDEDGLGFSIYWESKVPLPVLTNWGRGEEKLGDQPLPVAFIGTTEDPPSPSQQQVWEWLNSHVDEALTRIQSACERSWKECYYWEGNEMEDDDEYFIKQVRIPPINTSDDIDNPRDPSSPSLIIIDLEQDWEMEHGFYVVLDPLNAKEDCWTTWDGMYDLGLVVEEDE